MLPSMYRPVALALVLLVASTTFAQRDRDAYNPNNQGSEITGQVNLLGTGSPAQNVTVRLERFSGGTIDTVNTDARGRFRFANISRAYYRVVINVAGYKPAQQDADLQTIAKVYLVFEVISESPSSLASLGSGPDVIDARVPPNARDEFVQGRSALAKKSYPEAVTHLQNAVTGYPEFFAARMLLATALIDQRQWSQAETVLLGTLEQRPENPPTMLALGEVYWRQKRYKEAEEILLAGLKLDDKAWHGFFTLGRLYWDTNQIPKSGAAVGRTLQLKTDFAEAHLLAGNILLKLNQQERALSSYQEYVKLSPKGEFVPQARDLIQKLQKSIGEKQ
ncbi:MAG TPA: tetratricopeptide repeat protein [Pyrinomonadaceae bacterium]|nr:tetratricopeptide repeat protein [Pyrinomonadaceae bacterium]